MFQVWAYQASDGTTQHGVFRSFTDFGGTDVSYHFHRLGFDGLPITYPGGGIRLDIVSGSCLKAARRIGAVNLGEAWRMCR